MTNIVRSAAVFAALIGPAAVAKAAVIIPPPSDATKLVVVPPNGAATTVGAALDPLYALAARRGTGTRLQCLGDSRCVVSMNASTAGTNAGFGKGWQSFTAWAEAYSGGVLNFDLSLAPPGCGGVEATIVALRVVNGGAGYTAPTIAIPAVSGFAATPIVSGGRIVGANVTACGAAIPYSITSASITITDPTGSGAILTPVIGGYGTFGAGGTTLPEILARLPDVVSGTWSGGLKPDLLVVMGGHNDLLALTAGPVSVRAMLGTAMAIVKGATAAGIHVIWAAETPTGKSALTGFSAAQQTQYQQQLEQYNAGLRLMAGLDPTLNPSRVPFELVDASKYMIDASVPGAAEPGYYKLVDKVHPSQWGAAILGALIEVAARPFYPVEAGFPYAPMPFDATNNRGGNLIPAWSGTDGSVTAPVTGTAPHGWYFSRVSGSATGSLTSTLTLPTAAAPDPTGQISPSWAWTLSFSNTGTATDYLQAQYSFAPGANVAAGDVLQWSCEAAWSGLQNVNQIGFYITDGNGLTSGYAQYKQDYFAPSYDAVAGAVPRPGAPQPFRLKVVFPVGASTVASNLIKVGMGVGVDASSAPGSSAVGMAAGAAGTFTWRNCQLNKVGQGVIP